MDITSLAGTVLFSAAVSTVKDLLIEAVKCGADLRGADLRGANLYGANLRGANLYGANLYGADLRSANLYGADLRGADLYGANLYGANLYGANLYGANLRSANLYGANLRGADLRSANLYGADLKEVKEADLVFARLQFIPETGAFEGWKKCKDEVIVKLLIPADAQRSHGTERKCRASHVKVLEVIGAKVGVSLHDGVTEYKKGKIVKADSFNEDRWNVCSSGIHFYITRAEAVAH